MESHLEDNVIDLQDIENLISFKDSVFSKIVLRFALINSYVNIVQRFRLACHEHFVSPESVHVEPHTSNTSTEMLRTFVAQFECSPTITPTKLAPRFLSQTGHGFIGKFMIIFISLNFATSYVMIKLRVPAEAPPRSYRTGSATKSEIPNPAVPSPETI